MWPRGLGELRSLCRIDLRVVDASLLGVNFVCNQAEQFSPTYPTPFGVLCTTGVAPHAPHGVAPDEAQHMRFAFDGQKRKQLRSNPKRGIGFEEAQEEQ